MKYVLLGLAVAVVAGLVFGLLTRRRAPEGLRPAPTRALGDRLGRTRQALGGRLGTLLGRGELDQTFWTGLEESLIAADVGVETSTEVVERVRAGHPTTPEAARQLLIDELKAVFAGKHRSLKRSQDPSAYMVVGVNGTGKTTTIAKLAHNFVQQGVRPILGAADTFRAAADEQLRQWAERVGVELVGGEPGSDPASVAHDAFTAARQRRADLVIVDTAGRLHSNQNLMAELAKIARVLRREAGTLDEVLLVLDATTGQNGIVQAEAFLEAIGITGVVLTKLDGTAKGGVVAAVERQTGVPVKLIGVGEGLEDLIPFEPDAFVEALLS